MNALTNTPWLTFLWSFAILWLAAKAGRLLRQRRDLAEDAREDFGVIQAATLTLLALIIGFTFSMAISRYDQRKNYEEQEANAIGTEYLRADLLAPPVAAQVRGLLSAYTAQRILFYRTRDSQQVEQIDAATLQLQGQLWSAIRGPAAAQPTPVAALVVSGMNDVLNSQGYTQAAWWNRIPLAAWGLMSLIALSSIFLVGYGAKHQQAGTFLHLVLPLVVAISFALIADIDSPRRGVIRVVPQNLLSLAVSLQQP